MSNLKIDDISNQILNNISDLVVILDKKTKEYIYYNDIVDKLLKKVKIDFVDLIYKDNCILNNKIYKIKAIENDNYIVLILSLKDEGYTDNETGLLNVNGFYLKFEQIYSYFYRTKKSLILSLIEIDNFYNLIKDLNYSELLFITKKIGDIIYSSVRNNVDIVARFYEDIFVLCLIDVDKEKALKIINRIRNNIYKYSINNLDFILNISSISKIIKPTTQKTSEIFDIFNNNINLILQRLSIEKKLSTGFNKIID
ncbi:MAG: GGDEF domain-containing protein [bacterium]